MRTLSEHELFASIENMIRDLDGKIGASGGGTSTVSRAAGGDQPNHVFFIEGEVMILAQMSRNDAISLMYQTGIPPDAYVVTTEGNPLYFSDTVNIPDEEIPQPYYLKHEDLPYGFAGKDGYFQFSSPEIAKLTLSSGPVDVDDCYYYYRRNRPNPTQTPQVTYDLVNKADVKGEYKYQLPLLCPAMMKGKSAQDIKTEFAAGRYPFVTFQRGDAFDKRPFCEPDDLKRQVDGLSGTSVGGSFPLEFGDFYRPTDKIGWRMGFDTMSSPSQKTQTVPLLIMPKGQIDTFNVNPGAQEPYHGAQGVYPVVLVEFVRDVNVFF